MRTDRRTGMMKANLCLRYFETHLKLCLVHVECNTGFVRMLEQGAAVVVFNIE